MNRPPARRGSDPENGRPADFQAPRAQQDHETDSLQPADPQTAAAPVVLPAGHRRFDSRPPPANGTCPETPATVPTDRAAEHAAKISAAPKNHQPTEPTFCRCINELPVWGFYRPKSAGTTSSLIPPATTNSQSASRTRLSQRGVTGISSEQYQ
jgi:hypothetical protein